jgi:5'-nucleotidase
MSKEKEDVALIDMDDTLCEYSRQLEADSKELFGNELAKLTEDARRHVGRLIRCQQGWYEKLQPIQLGFDIAEMLKTAGFKLMILTKGNTGILNAWNEKIVWCKKHIPDALITITEDKGLMYGKILVDDYPGYIKRWLEWRPRGLVIMPDRYGNHGNQGFEHENVIRIHGPEDYEMLKIHIQGALLR